MGKVLYCTNFEVSHSKDAFIMIFRFTSPDGHTESAYIVITPEGASVVHEALGKELEEYIKKFGNIPLGEWIKEPKNSNSQKSNSPYLT